jgi:hypothetical protein
VWDHDYLYLALAALDDIRRAASMTVADNEYERVNSLDLNITAVQ